MKKYQSGCAADAQATASPYQVIPLEELSGLITVASVADDVLEPYRQRGITVHLAYNAH